MLLLLLFAFVGSGLGTRPYYGAKVGEFTTYFHDVRGDVFAVNDKTLFIENFNYDGKGADAVFWVGGTTEPDSTGFMVHVGQDSEETLGPSKDQSLILHLPAGIKITDLRWLSVWSRKFSISFGSVIFPKIVAPPRPTVIGPLNNTREGVSSGDVLVIDSQTFFIPNFNYDGSGQNVRWWASKESKTNLEDLPLYDEGGRDLPLQQYQNETVIISLPDGYSVFDYRFLSLWSSSENENYGSVEIPSDLNIPPSPRILDLVTEREVNKFNCEMLNDNLGLQVRWLIKGNGIIIHLVGNIEHSEYMALGFSKDDTETKFDGADAAITWLDKDGKGHVADYYLENTEICENGHGMCPDDTYEGSGNNLILLSAKKFNGTTTITFKRPLKAEDKLYDQNIYTDGPQAVLWAIGSIQDGNLVASPTVRTKGNLLLDFGRDPNWNCPPLKDDGLQLNTVQHHQFEIRCPSDHLFRAQMGPSPYQNISNVWYINGLPTPQLTVQRGQEYVFIVEGGMGPSVRNPLYITDSEEGGLYQNLLEATDSQETFFAGVHHDVVNSLYFPTSEGRLCQWSISDEDPEHSVTTSFADSTSALMLSCEPGNPARLIWTPDANTPDNLYYQSFTEKHLGGKIRVLDFCEETTSHSYLQNASSIIAEKSRIKGGHFKPELEREQDFKELEHITNSDSSNKETEVEKEQQDLEQEVGEQYKNTINKISDNNENNLSLKNQRSANIISHQGEENRNIEFDTIKNNSSEEIEISDSSLIEEPLSLDIFQPLMSDALHPHDESERSDKNIHQHQNSEATTVQHNKIPVGVHTTHEKPQMNQKIPSFAVFRNEPPKTPREPPRFRPQFQGGFVPLVLNPVKEKESSSSHNLDLAASHFRRPHRPFLFNESIPFHGTFKPGVPDFSGFNISHYTQDESYPLNHVLDNLPALTGSNPQMIQRPLTSMNGLPPELFQRQPGPAQRLQIFGYLPRQKPLGFGFYRQHAGLSQLPNIRRPNSGEDELSEISSQRVPVAFQSSVENKGKGEGMPHLQIMHIPDRKLKNKPQTNNVIHTPPIQRRPDFVGEGEAPLNSPLFKPPQMHNYPERLPVKNNENLENQRAPTTLKFNGLRNPQGMKQPVPLVKTQFNGMERDNLPSRIPPRGFLRKPNPFMQNSQKEMLPHFPGSQRDTSFLHKAPSHSDIIKPRDRVPNISTSNKFHHRPSIVNPTVVKSAENNEKVKASEDLELPVSKDKEIFPPFLQPEIIQHSKNFRPQLFAVSHSNVQNIPSLMIPNRAQIPPRPILPVKEEIAIKKLPIPMQEFKHQSTADHLIPHADPVALGHLPSDKIEKQRNTAHQNHDLGKANVTIHETPDTFKSDLNKDSRKSNLPPSKFFDSSATVDQSDNLKDTDEKQQFSSNEDDNNNSEKVDVTMIADYPDYDVPFGARLKNTPNNGSTKPKLTSQILNRPFPRKPQLTSTSYLERFTDTPILSTAPEPDIRHSEEDNEKQEFFDTTVLPFLESFTTKEILPAKETDLQNESMNNPQKFEPLFLDDATLEKHKGRKNILPNSSGKDFDHPAFPPKVPDNINLPHISEKPPSHDNGTDYSILNHVLSLIGGSS